MCWQQTTLDKIQSQKKWRWLRLYYFMGDFDCMEDNNNLIYGDDTSWWQCQCDSKNNHDDIYRDMCHDFPNLAENIVCWRNFLFQLHDQWPGWEWEMQLEGRGLLWKWWSVIHVIVIAIFILCNIYKTKCNTYTWQFPDGILFPDTISINLTLTIDPLARFL